MRRNYQIRTFDDRVKQIILTGETGLVNSATWWNKHSSRASFQVQLIKNTQRCNYIVLWKSYEWKRSRGRPERRINRILEGHHLDEESAREANVKHHAEAFAQPRDTRAAQWWRWWWWWQWHETWHNQDCECRAMVIFGLCNMVM